MLSHTDSSGRIWPEHLECLNSAYLGWTIWAGDSGVMVWKMVFWYTLVSHNQSLLEWHSCWWPCSHPHGHFLPSLNVYFQPRWCMHHVMNHKSSQTDSYPNKKKTVHPKCPLVFIQHIQKFITAWGPIQTRYKTYRTIANLNGGWYEVWNGFRFT